MERLQQEDEERDSPPTQDCLDQKVPQATLDITPSGPPALGVIPLSFDEYDASKEGVNRPTSDQGCRVCPQQHKAFWDFSASPLPEVGKATACDVSSAHTDLVFATSRLFTWGSASFHRALSWLLSQFYIQ